MSQDRNARCDRRHGPCVVHMVRADDAMVEIRLVRYFSRLNIPPSHRGDASVGGPRSYIAGSGPDDSASSLYLLDLTEAQEYAYCYRSYTGTLVDRLR